MKPIKCECGNLMHCDVKDAQRVASVWGNYYEWMCNHCGRVIRKKTKNPKYVD